MSNKLSPSLQEIKERELQKALGHFCETCIPMDQAQHDREVGIFNSAWISCYSHMIAQASEGFDEKAATMQCRYKYGFSENTAHWLEGARWQHDQTALHIRDLEEKLNVAIETLKESGRHFSSIRSGLTTDINRVEYETKKLAHEALVEVNVGLAKIGDVKNEQ